MNAIDPVTDFRIAEAPLVTVDDAVALLTMLVDLTDPHDKIGGALSMLTDRIQKLEREVKHARYFEIHDDAIDIFTNNLRNRATGTRLEALADDCATNIEQLRKERDEWKARAEGRL